MGLYSDVYLPFSTIIDSLDGLKENAEGLLISELPSTRLFKRDMPDVFQSENEFYGFWDD